MQEAARRIFWHGRRSSGYWGLCFTAEEPNVVVNMAKAGSPPAVTLVYSTDGRKWLSFDANNSTTPVTLKKAGSRVYFRAGSGGNAAMANGTGAYRKFTCSGYCAASGNVMSLLDAEDEEKSSLSSNGVFCKLFEGNAYLTSAPTLPATTLTDYCYSYMFDGCTSLTTAPALPATTLAIQCYYRMFASCSSLTTAPALPATTLQNYCYSYMFSGCMSLTTAPALPATTLAIQCYYRMFASCTSLVTAPALPAMTLAGYCYDSMF